MSEELLLIRNWWSLALRGIVAVLFGLVILIWPAITVEVLIMLFGVFAFAGGIFSILASLNTKGAGALILEGLLGIVIGLISFFSPGITAVALLIIIAVWAIITGGLEIILALRLHEEIPGKWLLTISGVLSMIFGLILMSRPGAGLLALTWLIGAYAIICGVLLFGLALHIHGLQKQI